MTRRGPSVRDVPAGAGRRRAAARNVAVGVLVTASCLAPVAAAQTESQVTLARKDTTIVVTLKARYADGARFIGNNPNCAPGERTTVLYGPDPGYVDTRVGKDTELRSNVAVVRSPEGGAGNAGAAGNGAAANGGAGNGGAGNGGAGNGGAASGGAGNGAAASGGAANGGAGNGGVASGGATSPADQQTLELFDGTVTIGRKGCIDGQQRATQPGVTLLQGRTTVKGTRFFLDQGKDTGSMDGPILLDRAAAGDSPSLKATADSMTFDTQTRHTTLSGNVRVSSGERVTTASTLELDEAAGIAVLAGSPAKSTKGQDVLQGNRLRYYLNTNDVVVLGNVQGDIQLNSP